LTSARASFVRIAIAAGLLASLDGVALPAQTGTPAATPAPNRQHQVLVVYSTRRDSRIAIVGERELPRLLEDGLGGRLDYYAEFIDPSRFSDTVYEDALATYLTKKYVDHQFDLLIAIGDDATRFVARHREIFGGSPPIVFYGASREHPRPANATGVVSEVDLKGTVLLASALDPDLRSVFVVSGADPRDRRFADLARAQLTELPSGLDATYLVGLPTGQLEERLRSLPAHSMVFYLVVSQDGTGEYFHPLQYLDRIVAVANAPTYSWVDSTLGQGVVGGMVKSQQAQVQAVAGVALRVLGGEPADSLPVAQPNLNQFQVDWKQLRRWGLPESRVPSGAALLFREPSPWERYRGYILATLILVGAQSALILGLLIQRSRRRKAEQRLIDSEARLRTSHDRIHDLGGRLLKAQEVERAHIARELHDDVSQQVALLEIDLEQLSSAAPGDTSGLADDALDRVHGIARSVHDLSHRLHPARLRLIGLVSAIQGLQRELSQSDIVIGFTHDRVPSSLPPDLMLCVFRVVQEALQNAIKYSRARQVTVDLQGTADGLALTIVDDGDGFDVQAAWGKGLGLISMGERLEAVGGRFDIRSTRGSGTRLKASVPLRAAPARTV
jgi:signal transduction histidine kinase